MDKYTALKTYFGHTAFRPGQEAVIDALLAGPRPSVLDAF